MSGLPLFIVAVAAILVSPGPTNTLLATSGALVGHRRSLPLMSAELVGYFVSIGFLIAVTGPLVAASAPFGLALRTVLVAYLLWLAWRLWRSEDHIDADGAIVTWRRVFVTTLLNPKGLIFAFGVFPPCARLEDAVPYFVTFAVMVPAIAAGWITFGAAIGHLADKERVPLPRVTAVVLLVFAAIVGSSVVRAIM